MGNMGLQWLFKQQQKPSIMGTIFCLWSIRQKRIPKVSFKKFWLTAVFVILSVLLKPRGVKKSIIFPIGTTRRSTPKTISSLNNSFSKMRGGSGFAQLDGK